MKVLGQGALGMFYVGTDQMLTGNYISEHDKKIADKLAYVMVGGNLSEPTVVTEPVSYTHLDVYKRQILFLSNCGKSAINFSITFAAITSGLVNLKLPFGALPTAVL